MTEENWLVEKFQDNRARLKSVAYRILGSTGEAEDAVQEGWLRLSRSDADRIENLGGWLTTVVARVCLDMLRSRKTRKEEPFEESFELPEKARDPEAELAFADSLGSALVILLNSLAPAERVAFVLHDLFDLPFEEIAPILGRSEPAVRQLASRARRRVRGGQEAVVEEARKREIVSAFLSASREGRFEDLIRLLDPEIKFHADDLAVKTAAQNRAYGAPIIEVEMTGPQKIAEAFRGRAKGIELALINGAVGAAWMVAGKPKVAIGFSVTGGRISEIDMVMEPEDIKSLSFELIGE
jgi:RNA polymerase sigma factor (sigma-70 family)